jgi:putative (di)nucleoside polyphosphate hydrolase
MGGPTIGGDRPLRRQLIRDIRMSSLSYRLCVGVMLFNASGLVFIGRRKNKRLVEHSAPGFEWQMPQGGIDKGEEPIAAARRELKEETNISSTRLIAQSAQWYTYDLPENISKSAWKGRYRGQTQKWFALRFEGDETEINIHHPAGGHKPEFDAWRWEHVDRLAELIIPFKRPVYERVIAEFAHLVPN